MELTGFVPLVRRWWPLLLLTTVIAGVAANVLASRLAPTYEASVSLLTGPINTDFGTLRASGELARTYSELATSGPVLEAAAKEAGVTGTTEELADSVAASANQVTRIVTVRVRDGDPGRAAEFANALARRLTVLSTRVPQQDTEAIDELMRAEEITALPEVTQGRIRGAVTRVFGQPTAGRLQVVDEAQPVDDPVAPPISLLTMLGALAGLIMAGAFALVREFSADAVLGEEELAHLTAAPVLGAVDGLPAGAGGADVLVVEASPESRTAESYRVLAAKIGLSEEDEPSRSLLVIGSEAGDRSGLLAANLAAAIAETDARVTLVDANTTDGEITKALGLAEQAGYAELLASVASADGAGLQLDGLRVRRSEDLDVLPRGQRSDAGFLIEPDRARVLLDRLLGEADVVVLNAPPIERSPSGLVWARVADATVLVVREGRSKREDVSDAVKSLSLVGANLIGTVVRERTSFARLRRR